MKRLLFLLLILLFNDISILFSQQQFTPPKWYTTYYRLRMWEQKAHPGADSLNRNWMDIDSLINELIMYVDTLQLQIVRDTLRFSKYMNGIDAFVDTATTDTVFRPGVDSSAVVLVTVRDTIPTVKDILSTEILVDKFVVKRQSGGIPNLKYNWIWIRKYW